MTYRAPVRSQKIIILENKETLSNSSRELSQRGKLTKKSDTPQICMKVRNLEINIREEARSLLFRQLDRVGIVKLICQILCNFEIFTLLK